MKTISRFGLLAFFLWVPALSSAQTPAKCRILRDTVAPITTPGTWCLGANVVGRGIAPA
jgi:hypothetical protein